VRKANRAFELIISRGGREPAFLADPARMDRIEVVSIDDGEVVLFWELPAKQAAKIAKEIRSDLITLDAGDFIELWEGRDVRAEPRP
jgi:hypothetical protein